MKEAEMTEEQWDKVHELYEAFTSDILDDLEIVTEKLDPEVDEALRRKLTEDFRFWRCPS